MLRMSDTWSIFLSSTYSLQKTCSLVFFVPTPFCWLTQFCRPSDMHLLARTLPLSPPAQSPPDSPFVFRPQQWPHGGPAGSLWHHPFWGHLRRPSGVPLAAEYGCHGERLPFSPRALKQTAPSAAVPCCSSADVLCKFILYPYSF